MDDKEQASMLVRAQIHLDLRVGDTSIGEKELEQFDLFRRMKKNIPIGKFPGSIVLRRYGQGDVIFQQGQAGGTAFYIPTAEDLVRLAAAQAGKEVPAEPVVNPNRTRQVLSALIIPSTSRPQPRGFFSGWFSSTKKTGTGKLAAIPSDGPSDIDSDTREAPLMEGDLFGEMSCISYMPRSATVIARVDCQLLEFNRNVFDKLRDDANHQAAVEKEYRRRTLDTHLRQFDLFRDLTDSQIRSLKDQVSLEVVPPGKVICEEGEQWSETAPLDVFIVRNGVVQVMVNSHLSIRPDDVRDWAALCRLLDESQPDPKVVQTPSAVKPASPLDKMRQAPAVAKTATTVSEPVHAVAVQPPLDTPPKKLSPLEQMRAKQAAAATDATPKSELPPQDEVATPVDPEVAADPPKKLSPIEQMRARQAAAAAVKPADDTAEAVPVDAVQTPADTAPKKLSPIEQIRAKQAAAAMEATPKSESPPPSVEVATPADPAVALDPLKKLSPIEQMRARQAAAKSAPKEPGSELVVRVDDTKSADPLAKKPSPLEIIRAKQDAGSSPATTPVVPSVVVPPPRIRKPKPDQSGSPAFLVKSWLNDHVLQAMQHVAKGEIPDEAAAADAKDLIRAALNELAGNPEFLGDKRLIAEVYAKPELMRKTASFPKGFKGIAKDWSELELRTAGRSVLSEIFPDQVRRPAESSGPPRVLAYLSRGDCIGEIVVVKRGSRNATCVAYNHPSTENPRDFGNVELVRIPGSAFRQLLDESPQLKARVEALAEKRLSQVQSLEDRYTEPDLIASTEFQQMGLFQGTKLLVIDLDSCTRCGDCVQACVDTHDDGASRLFLDGPRYDRFLVPSACRSCLNPVCMIGCPVGSIGRGENSQIEIYDWCIGCSACAEQCPYDSIQMHDIGLIPEESSGWLYADRRSLTDDWCTSSRLGAGWMQGQSPFRCQGELLRQLTSSDPVAAKDPRIRFCFRHEFRLPKTSSSQHFRISINDDRRKGAVEKVRVKKSKTVGVWLNGEKLEWSGSSLDLPRDRFSRTNNVLAIEVELEARPEYGQFILSACLDAIPEIGAQTLEVLGKDVRIEMDLVTSRAAVCDLCSHVPSQQPACVSSCPHDAAIRINPLVHFPI